MTGGAGPRRWRLVRARTDAVPPSVRRFMRRARHRRLRAALPWAVAGAVLTVVGLLAWLVFNTAVFGVTEVRVTGTDVLAPDQVRAVAAVVTETPLARVDLGAVEARVGALAPVERVTVTREWPRAIGVRITERTAVATVQHGRAFLLVDATGAAYHTIPARPAHLPLVRVPAPGPDDRATRSALLVLAALPPALRDPLVEVVVLGPARIRLRLTKGREVVWGDATENAAKAKSAAVLLARGSKVMDVSAPDVVTFR